MFCDIFRYSQKLKQYLIMSLQWSLIAGFLYVEVIIVLLLVLPIISPTRWQKIFKSQFLKSLSDRASIYFLILLAILVVILLDAIREMRKYSTVVAVERDHHHVDAGLQGVYSYIYYIRYYIYLEFRI